MKRKSVLIVDDSCTIREMVGYILKTINFDVLEAEDGVEAIFALSKYNPDLIVTDCNMPNIDGFELVKYVRGELGMKELPILMLTTECSEEMKNRGRAVGATGWVVKPFDPERFITVVQKVCGMIK
jgi:two-component system chemotaxis response regulator CheY